MRSRIHAGVVLVSEQALENANSWPTCLGEQKMDVSKMLAELRQERSAIEEAILILERLARGRGKRRGRPPLWMTTGEAPVRRRGRPPGSKNKPKDTSTDD